MLTADRDGTRGVLWPHDRLSAYVTLIVSFLLALGKGAPTEADARTRQIAAAQP
jgi:hypothetical protein